METACQMPMAHACSTQPHTTQPRRPQYGMAVPYAPYGCTVCTMQSYGRYRTWFYALPPDNLQTHDRLMNSTTPHVGSHQPFLGTDPCQRTFLPICTQDSVESFSASGKLEAKLTRVENSHGTNPLSYRWRFANTPSPETSRIRIQQVHCIGNLLPRRDISRHRRISLLRCLDHIKIP